MQEMSFLQREESETEFIKHELGTLYNVEIFVMLHHSEMKEQVRLNDLPQSIKTQILEYKEEQQKTSLMKYIIFGDPYEFELSHNAYYDLLAYKESIFSNRSVSDHVYLLYILQSFNLRELRSICKTYKVKGYSRNTKRNLILLIRNNLSEEEQREFLRENEKQIIEKHIERAFDILHKRGNERLLTFRIVNQEEGYIEAQFEGKVNPNTMWTTDCYLSINKQNINDPERDCDCGIGSSNGFCPHFWVIFFIALKLGSLHYTDWKLTYLPFGIQSKLSIIDSLIKERM